MNMLHVALMDAGGMVEVIVACNAHEAHIMYSDLDAHYVLRFPIPESLKGLFSVEYCVMVHGARMEEMDQTEIDFVRMVSALTVANAIQDGFDPYVDDSGDLTGIKQY